ESVRCRSGRPLAQQDVDLAVTVEVTHTDDVPVQVRDRQDRGAARDGAAVHEPDLVLAGDRVVPEDVGLAVAAEVAHASDGPVLVGARGGRRGTRGPADVR